MYLMGGAGFTAKAVYTGTTAGSTRASMIPKAKRPPLFGIQCSILHGLGRRGLAADELPQARPHDHRVGETASDCPDRELTRRHSRVAFRVKQPRPIDGHRGEGQRLLVQDRGIVTAAVDWKRIRGADTLRESTLDNVILASSRIEP